MGKQLLLLGFPVANTARVLVVKSSQYIQFNPLPAGFTKGNVVRVKRDLVASVVPTIPT